MKKKSHITQMNKARNKTKEESKKKEVSENKAQELSTTKKKRDNQNVLVTLQQVYPHKQNNIQSVNPLNANKKSSTTTDPKTNNNQSSPKKVSPEATQSSPKFTPPKNDIIPEYEKKKKMSDQLVGLCNDVLVLTQMVNNANTQKGNLIKQYKTVIRGIQSSFKNINDENVYRTKDHIF